MLLTLLTVAFAGGGEGPAPEPPFMLLSPPVLVHATQDVDGYTRLAFVNNTSVDFTIDLWTENPDEVPYNDEGFRVLEEQGKSLCPWPEDAPHGDNIPPYSRCTFTLRTGHQQDVIVSYNPRGPIPDVMGMANVTMTPADGSGRVYRVDTPLIGRSEREGAY